MVSAGIEAMNVFAGTTFLDVEKLAQHRDLDRTRFENLMMKEKSLALPYEDPITFAVNAAKPIIDALSKEEKELMEKMRGSENFKPNPGKNDKGFFEKMKEFF